MADSYALKSKRTFRQILVAISAFSGLLVFLIYRISENAYSFGTVLIHKLTTDCDCAPMTALLSMHPYIFGALSTLSILIISAFIFFIAKLARLIYRTRKFYGSYTKLSKTKHSPKLREILSNIGLGRDKVIEIREAKPIVFCYGFWIPRICISTGLVKMLNRNELQAVMLHENSHRRSYEPAKLFIVKFFCSIFFFLPGLKTYARQYATYSELAADEKATNNFTDKPRLAIAILKISEKEDRILLRDGLALSFFSSTIEERVNKLADNNYTPQFRLLGRGVLFNLGALVIAVMLLVGLTADSSAAFAMHNRSCSADSKESTENATACLSNSNQLSCEANPSVPHSSQSCYEK
ncbi:MAG: M56 family metallopeptidase [Patescibacteria group bacterium]